MAHLCELVVVSCNLRMTWQRIYGAIPALGGKLSHRTMGVLGMCASLAVILKMWFERKTKPGMKVKGASADADGKKTTGGRKAIEKAFARAIRSESPRGR